MTLWISHRGLARDFPENTLGAFRAAREAGFEYFETDLRATSDGHIVLIHDDSPRRIGGPDLRIEQTDRQTLARIELPANQSLLFADQWFGEFGADHWTLDLKKESALRVIPILARWAAQDSLLAEFIAHRARFVVWSEAHRLALVEAFPGAICYPGRGACYRAGIACLMGCPGLGGIRPDQVYSLPPRIAGIPLYRPSMLRRYHRYGARVLAYLPETEAETRQALAVGCAEILTNHPPLDQRG